MKRYPLVVIAGLSLMIAFSAKQASAQITNQIDLSVSFPFYAGNTKLPAGKYVITPPDDNDPSVLELRSSDGKLGVLIEVREVKADSTPSKTELVFKKYGTQEILYQIFEQGNLGGVELISGRPEQRATKGGSTAEKHSVVAASSKTVKKTM